MRHWRVAGINFDHLHMGDLLREVYEHPSAEIVGICHEDTERMAAARKALDIPDDRVFTDVDRCIRTTKPDLDRPLPGDRRPRRLCRARRAVWDRHPGREAVCGDRSPMPTG